jgi:hypothetical protein
MAGCRFGFVGKFVDNWPPIRCVWDRPIAHDLVRDDIRLVLRAFVVVLA